MKKSKKTIIVITVIILVTLAGYMYHNIYSTINRTTCDIYSIFINHYWHINAELQKSLEEWNKQNKHHLLLTVEEEDFIISTLLRLNNRALDINASDLFHQLESRGSITTQAVYELLEINDLTDDTSEFIKQLILLRQEFYRDFAKCRHTRKIDIDKFSHILIDYKITGEGLRKQ